MTLASFPSCPACESLKTRDIGALPIPPATFGGKKISAPLAAGRLYFCRECFLYFRFPAPTQEALTRLYQDLPDAIWTAQDPKPFWKLAARHLRDSLPPAARVLDVGAYSGDFLAGLPERWEKFAIEPVSAVHAVLLSRGIRCLGSTLEDTATGHGTMDAVLLFDVIEHFVKPFDILSRAASFLGDKGRLVIVTGSTDCWQWKMFKPHYWYSALPEHMSFCGSRWFRWAATRLGMRVVVSRPISPEKISITKSVLMLAKTCLWVCARNLRKQGIPENVLAALPGIGKAACWQYAPAWMGARDHILIVLEKV